MRQSLKVLKRKELKKIFGIIEKQWGFYPEFEYYFFMNNKNKLYIINKDFAKIDETKLRIDNIGMYFGEVIGNEMRLSIEGSQLVGKSAKKNIIEVHPNIMRLWLHGYDIEADSNGSGFVILKCGNDFIGCGRMKDKKVTNFIPKTRRLRSSD